MLRTNSADKKAFGSVHAGKGASNALSTRGIFFMVCLAMQYGWQPVLNRWYLPAGVTPSSVVLLQEILKFLLSLLAVMVEGPGLTQALKNWTFTSSLLVAALPAAIYALQNVCMWLAVSNLDGLTYNLLNQSKLIWTAFFVFLLAGKRQSKMQIVALGLLFATAALLSAKEDETTKTNDFWLGVVPVLVASACSGLGGGLSELALQGKGRNSYIFTMELCVFTTLTLLITLPFTSDGAKILETGLLHNWTPMTVVPIFLNASGGLFVGQVVKYAGGVQKGFSIIFALMITAVLQWAVLGHSLNPSTMGLALPLGLLGLFIHTKFPYQPAKKEHQ
mmetsp:Transcript_20311/g.47453  ORF Transcript_20311/g.47453 Transcript_20311/m.47453 type:complete len:334 (-) Transcript_20311:41-1042(-)